MGCAARRRAALSRPIGRPKLTLEEFEGPRYQRISHIQMLIGNKVLGQDLRHTRTGTTSDVAGSEAATSLA